MGLKIGQKGVDIMSTEVKAKAKVLRKATFVLDEVKGQRIFRPVNKRAHKYAKKVGKRTRLLPADIKAIKALNKVKVYVYGAEGSLRAVR